MKDSHQKILRKTRYFKLMRFTALIILPSLCIVLNQQKSLGAPGPSQPTTASFDMINGSAIITSTQPHKPPTDRRASREASMTGIGYSEGSIPDTLSIQGTSFVHLRLLSRVSSESDTLVKLGSQSTKYKFACNVQSGTSVWGVKGGGPCKEGVYVPRKKGTRLGALMLPFKTTYKIAMLPSQEPFRMLAQPQYVAQNTTSSGDTILPILDQPQYIAQTVGSQGNTILNQLIGVNIFYSVSPNDLIDWINLPDRRYFNVAVECLNILQKQVLKDSAPDFDVIFYKYFILAGYDPIGRLDQIPQNPQIDQSILREAIRQSFNERNGTNFSSFEEIVEDEIIILPTSETALFSISNSEAELRVEVLIGSVQVEAPNSSPKTIQQKERYILSINGTDRMEDVNLLDSLQSEPFLTFLDPTLWSPEVRPSIQVLLNNLPFGPR